MSETILVECPECGRERETSSPFDGEIARGMSCAGCVTNSVSHLTSATEHKKANTEE